MAIIRVELGIINIGRRTIHEPNPHLAPAESEDRAAMIAKLEAVQARINAAPRSELAQRKLGRDFTPEYKATLLAQAHEIWRRNIQNRPATPKPPFLSRVKDLFVSTNREPEPPTPDPNRERYMQELNELAAARGSVRMIEVFSAPNKR